MSIFLEVLLSVLGSVLIMSGIEYFLHGYLMHQRFLPEIFYRYIPGLEKTLYAHVTLHHKTYYQTFNNEPDPYGREVNIGIRLTHPILGTLAVLPFGIPFALYISWIPPVTLVATFFVHRIIWNVIHREMHQPKYPWWSRTAVYRYLARYHFLHHQHISKNINIVIPIADFVMGRHITATPEEQETMKKMRFLL